MQATPTPSAYQPPFPPRAGTYTPQTHPNIYQTSPLPPQYATPPHTTYSSYPGNRVPVPPPPTYNPNAPRPIEVFHLSDTANAAIPADIRQQFHLDEQGRILFFSTPPLDIIQRMDQRLGHSLKYLAAKEERQKLIEEKKRKARDEDALDRESKRSRNSGQPVASIEDLTAKAVVILADQIASRTDEFYSMLYGERAEEVKAADQKERERKELAGQLLQKQTAQIRHLSKASQQVSLKGSAVYMDDFDLRI
jgi:chromatin structure-remodeling complex subunit RSC1/2